MIARRFRFATGIMIVLSAGMSKDLNPFFVHNPVDYCLGPEQNHYDPRFILYFG